MSRGFQNNPNLPREDYQHSFTQHELDEFIKCAKDPVYFSETYIKIVTVDKGLQPFIMWDFQKEMLQTFHDNRFSICKLPRQVGKTTTTVAFLLHYLLFNQNVNVAILANKSATAREILGRLQLAFEYLPTFLKQGVKEWNKGSIELANGSRALADSTSGSSVRGRTFNIIFLDEFAHVPNNIAEAFFMSTYPTISSGKTTKVIIVSTPNGLNLFYKMWKDATEKRSLYIPIEIHWSQVPGRDEKWKEEIIKNTSLEQWNQEFECDFVGSTNTLISAAKLKLMTFLNPTRKDGDFDIYEEPKEDHSYVVTVDVARGQGLDYSAFIVIDVTDVPYKMVAKYRSNKIQAMLFPTIIYNVGRKYNDAFILVEISDIGQQVTDILHFELEYENLVKVQVKGKQGQQVSAGHVKKIAFGLKQSVATKRIGCANLKTLIETDKLIIHDVDTIMELTTFTAQKDSFKAEEGNHDDLAMSLVLFGWFAAQRHFKEALKEDIRKVLQMEQMNLSDEDMAPFGLIDNGIDDPLIDEHEKRFNEWMNERQKKDPLTSMEYDYKGDFFKNDRR